MKIYQVEDENVGVKAGHRVEMVGESVVRSTFRRYKLSPYRKVEKLERNLSKKSAKLTHKRTVEARKKPKKNIISRMWQRRKIKKQYAKQAHQAHKTAKQTATLTTKTTQLAMALTKKNPKLWIGVLSIALLMYMVMSFASLFSALGSGGAGVMLISSYLADDTEITHASVLYTSLEQELIDEIGNIQNNHTGFNEYRIDIDINHIRHNPLELMAYLTAVHLDFRYADISVHLQGLFDAQYQLIFTPTIEIRFYEDYYGNLIPFDWHVLTVTLESRSLSEVIQERLSYEQLAHFDVLMETMGNRQTITSPFDFNWHPHISSHFGYRISPIAGGREFHGGIDIALPTGTPIHAGHDGIVTFSGYNTGGFGNLVIIDSGDGLVTKYAHCHDLLVVTGQRVSAGDLIATVGSTGASTGAHLHMEVLLHGQRKNPIFLVDSGR
jgi:murein DD-endopeptidase MepM/ murein hydrolase activator NlpD